MKVVVKDGDGKVVKKVWGNLVCVHDLEKGVFKANDLSGTGVVFVDRPKCVYENEVDGSLTVEMEK